MISVAFQYSKASVRVRCPAEGDRTEFGEPHRTQGGVAAHKKSRQVGQVLDGLDQATEVASHDRGKWTSSMWMLIGVLLERKELPS